MLVAESFSLSFLSEHWFSVAFRYGCPGSVSDDYGAFADFYDKHFAGLQA